MAAADGLDDVSRTILDKIAQAPLQLSPLVKPCEVLAWAMIASDIEGIVFMDRESLYRDGSRLGWWKVKPGQSYEREAWRFEGR